MSILFKRYKRSFRLNLQPLFAVLVDKRKNMDGRKWELLVKTTVNRVAQRPVEYLGKDFPQQPLLSTILEDIQNEFLKEMQSRKGETKLQKL